MFLEILFGYFHPANKDKKGLYSLCGGLRIASNIFPSHVFFLSLRHTKDVKNRTC